MPTNLPIEWSLAEKEYQNAKTLEEKIEALKKLISATPKHKGTENLRSDLRKRLSKLEDQLERRSKKTGRRIETIKKTADILVPIIGLTQSGKSTLLKGLTNASVEISDKPYTTREPITGVSFFEGVNIQFVEIPSFFLRKDISIAQNSDVILLLVHSEQDLEKLREVLKQNKLEKKNKIIISKIKNQAEFFSKILKESNVVRIFTKPIGKKIAEKAVVLKNGSVMEDLVRHVNQSWLKSFKFARVFDKTKFSGRRVGLNYLLKDGDVVEIHAG